MNMTKIVLTAAYVAFVAATLFAVGNVGQYFDAAAFIFVVVVAGFCVVLAKGSSYDSVNYVWFMERYDDVLYLDRVAFDAAAQGQGLGSALYNEVDRRLAGQALGLTLEVNVDPPNEPSLAFHRKHGYVEVGRQMSKGIEVALMHKPAQ